jgi:hypothetical protein
MKLFISIFLTCAVAVANGACPCGLAVVLPHAFVASEATVRCAACHRPHGAVGSDGKPTCAEQCARTVSAERPAPADAAPAVVAVPILYLLSRPLEASSLVVLPQPPIGALPEPPTLFNLACSLTV